MIVAVWVRISECSVTPKARKIAITIVFCKKQMGI